MLQFYFEEAAYHESPNKLPAVWAFFISNKMVSYHILDQSTQHFTVMIAWYSLLFMSAWRIIREEGRGRDLREGA